MSPSTSPRDSSGTSQTGAETEVVHKPPIWPLALFIAAALFLAPAAFSMTLFVAFGGMMGLAQGFQEGGSFMYLLMMGELVGVVLYGAASYFYIVTRKLPASLLLIPVAFTMMVGILGSQLGVAQVLDGISMAAPDQTMAFAFRGLSMTAHIVIMAALVAGSLTGLVLLVATL